VADEPPGEWRSDVTLVMDDESFILDLHFDGQPIPVDRRDVRPPDFDVTEAHRFWEPADVTSWPMVVTEFEPLPLDE